VLAWRPALWPASVSRRPGLLPLRLSVEPRQPAMLRRPPIWNTHRLASAKCGGNPLEASAAFTQSASHAVLTLRNKGGKK
jgi:hypothetical protein